MFGFRKYQIEYASSPEETERAIDLVLQKPEYDSIVAEVSDDKVKLYKRPSLFFHNSFNPVFSGHFSRRGNGTTLTGIFRMSWYAIGFFFVFFGMMGYEIFDTMSQPEHRQGYVEGWKQGELGEHVEFLLLASLVFVVGWVVGLPSRNAILRAIRESAQSRPENAANRLGSFSAATSAAQPDPTWIDRLNEPLRRQLVRADSWSDRKVLWINVGIACLIALSHGAALASVAAKPAPGMEEIRQIAMFSLPIAALVIFSGLAGLVRTDWRARVLSFHGLILVVAALGLLYWAATLLMSGIPEGNFSWGVGLLSASVWYGFFVLSRFSLADYLKTYPLIYYLPVIVLLLAVPLDVGVFLKMLGSMGEHFGKYGN